MILPSHRLGTAQAMPLKTNIVVTTTIQAAIDAAIPGDTIIIPTGIYTESLTLSKAISLTGINSHTTIINAIDSHRVLTITGAMVDNTVIISGLTFSGGDLTWGNSCPTNCGGGILVNGNAKPLIKNVVITNNQAGSLGGGIYAASGSPLHLVQTDFISNSAISSGGGGTFGDVNLVGGRFENNQSNFGGGLWAAGNLTLTNTIFISNTGQLGGGGAAVQGTATISGGHFEHNLVNTTGGGLIVEGDLTAKDTKFIDNQATTQGGGVTAAADVMLTGGHFENNRVQMFGGGLYSLGNTIISETNFISNTATFGGGIYHTGSNSGRIVNVLLGRNKASGSGAGISLDSTGTAEILHTTIVDTNSNSGEAIAIANSTVGITNTLIVNYAIGISYTSGAVFEDYNLFFNTPITKTVSVDSGGHSLIGDPRFIAPSSDNYQLGTNSAAIDKGVNVGVDKDIANTIRPQGNGFDIGAFEFGTTPPPNPGGDFTVFLPLVVK